MKIIICNANGRPSEFIILAQNSANYECLGYAQEGEEYTGSMAGFEQRYRPGRVSFSSIDELKQDYQLHLESQFPKWVDEHCKALTLHSEMLNDAEDSIVSVHGTTWQTGPRSIEKLNNILTTYTPIGAIPNGFQWWDADNVPHTADLHFLAAIASAEAERQYQNFVTCQSLKGAARSIVPAPGCIQQLQAITWPEQN